VTEAPRPYEPTWEPEAIDRLAALIHEYPEAAQAVVPAIHELAANPNQPGRGRSARVAFADCCSATSA
jgi:hypothetical protein